MTEIYVKLPGLNNLVYDKYDLCAFYKDSETPIVRDGYVYYRVNTAFNQILKIRRIDTTDNTVEELVGVVTDTIRTPKLWEYCLSESGQPTYCSLTANSEYPVQLIEPVFVPLDILESTA